MKGNNQCRGIAIVSSLALITVCLACKKNNPNPPPGLNENVLPPVTTTGENTFGCLLDGVVYVPKGNWMYKAIEPPVYDLNDSSFWVQTLNKYDFDLDPYVFIYTRSGLVFENGVYEDFSSSTVPAYTVYDQGVYDYFIDTSKFHFIEILRFDLENKIISGLFEFTVVNEALSDTIVIDSGRFDLRNIVLDQ